MLDADMIALLNDLHGYNKSVDGMLTQFDAHADLAECCLDLNQLALPYVDAWLHSIDIDTVARRIIESDSGVEEDATC